MLPDDWRDARRREAAKRARIMRYEFYGLTDEERLRRERAAGWNPRDRRRRLPRSQ